jgi:hypothetical protein
MVAPVLAVRDEWAAALGSWGPLLISTVGFLVGLVGLPALLVGLATSTSRWWGGCFGSWRETACRFCYCLVPLGFGMWLAHYGFHLFTSYATVVPAVQRASLDLGFTALGPPQWTCACCLPVADWLLRVEILFLDVGLLLSLYAAYRIAKDGRPDLGAAVRAASPWALLLVGLFAFGVWILFQPMEMRGTLS